MWRTGGEEGTWRHIGKKNRRRQFPADSTRFFPYLSRKARWLLVMVRSLSFVLSLSERLVGLEGTRTYGLRLVYLRTKCFLFGPRATCASHGGFVAARTREGDGAARAKPRHAFEEKRVSFPPPSRSFTFLNLSFLPPSLSLSKRPACDLRVRARVNSKKTHSISPTSMLSHTRLDVSNDQIIFRRKTSIIYI